MIDVKLIPRKWGNSIAVVLPESVVKQAKIRVGEPIELLIPQQENLQSVWGIWKTKKPAQKFKDEARAGWD